MRRAFIVFAWLLAFALVAITSLPWWMGPALGVLGKRYGLTFGRYERLGYSRFALSDVRWQRGTVDVRARRVEGETPLRWAWRRWRHTPGPWTVSDWRVDVARSEIKSEPPTPKGWVWLRARLTRISEGLHRWLPPTTLIEGAVRWPADGLTLGKASWESGKLRVERLGFKALNGNATIDCPNGDDLVVSALPVEGKTWEFRATSRGTVVDGEARLWGQPASFQAQFSESSGWLPQEGRLLARDWVVLASQLSLGTAYSTASGSASIEWSGERGTISLDARAEPAKGGGAPPLTAVVRANGDQTTVRVERVDLNAPGITARLSQPVVLTRAGQLQSPDSTFAIAVELDKQPWLKAKGRVGGDVTVSRAPDGKPRFEGRFSGEKISGSGWEIPFMRAAARLTWPVLEVTEADLRWGERDTLTARGTFDLKQRMLTASSLRGRIPRIAFAAWLPEALTFDAVSLEAESSGRWPELAHQGKFSVERILFPPVRPSAVGVEWRGVGREFEELRGTLAAGTTEIEVSAKLSREVLELKGARVTQDDIEQVVLKSPAILRWTPIVSIQNLNLAGPGGSLSAKLENGEKGVIEILAQGISPTLWKDIIPTAGPPWLLHTLDLKGGWDRGPLTFTAQVAATINLSDDSAADVSVLARGDHKGVRLEKAGVSIGGEQVLTATAALPVTVAIAPRWAMSFDPAAEFRLQATTEKSPLFWKRMADLTRLQIDDPEVSVDLLGSWRAPRGQAIVRASRLGIRSKEGSKSWPTLEEINAELVGDGAHLTLKTLSAKIAGQSVQAEATLPLPVQFGKNPKEKIREWVESKLDARVRIQDVDLAAVSAFAPSWIGPTGRASVDFSVKPPAQFEGTIRVHQAMSRPLGPLGAVQSIEADLEFKGRRLEIRRLEGLTGGQPVILAGSAEIRPGEGMKLDVSLKGANLPFVRQTGLLIRGDLDLKLTTPSAGETKVSGKAHLRDSLFLTDVRAYIPRGGPRGAPTRRPPYFSIETPPFATWHLDVEVEGKRFLRLRTPIFSGLASARFRLDGTLLEPRAIGEATVEEGVVTLPFATFRVQQGEVSLTQSNPYDPRVSVAATSRRFGYDLQMELSGSATSPTVLFSSSPALSSEQVLLLVMAGEAPDSDIAYSGGQRAVRLGAYLGQSLLGQIGADPERAERFSLSVGERVSREGRETYALEYPINDRFSLVGEYDEFDDYNVGVKWRALVDDGKEKKKP